jgi:hypothetical protein
VATLAARRIVASGIPVLGGDGGVFEIGRLTLERPLLFLHPVSGDDGPEREWSPADPVLRVDRFQIDGGTVLVWRPGATSGPRQALTRDVVIEGRAIAFDGAGRVTGAPADLSWRTGAFSRTRADGLTRVSFDSLRARRADSGFVLAGVRLAPTTSDAEYFRRLTSRADRIRAELPRVRARGADLDAWLRGDLVARTVELDSVDVDVLSDRRLPAGSDSSPPPMPPDLVRSFGGEVRIDTIEFTGRIVYREIPERAAAEPARIGFERLDGRIRRLSSVSGAPPIVVEASMDVFEAPAEIRIEIPYDTSAYRMNMTGRVGAIDLTRLNALTVPLQGIEVQGGRLAGMRFDVTVDGRSAGGTVWAAYQDLDVQMVDRETGKGGLFDDIKSFVTNTFVLRGDNMPGDGDGEGARPGAVKYYVEPDDPFFTRVWAPIRSGLMAAARK